MNALAKDLNTLISSNRVRTDPEDLFAYSNDATFYFKKSMPDAVVLPESSEEVARILKYAFHREIPVTPRGAGSGLSGGCTPVHGGIVIDMKRMRRVLELDRSNMTSEVEAGVVLSNFHRTVEKMGLFYPPDPQSMSVCTIGGNVATRAGGPRGVKYGTTERYVLGLEAVLSDGSIIKCGSKSVKNSAGYDITHLMTGSEGTLGVITKATLRLLSLPAARKTMVVICETTDQAAAIISEIIARGMVPAVLEFLQRGAVGLMNYYISPPLVADAEAYLLLQVDGTAAQVEAESAGIKDFCLQMKVRDVRIIEDEREAGSYWEARSALHPLIMRVFKRIITEDVSVPRNLLPEMVGSLTELSAALGINIGFSGHAGDGNVHPSILFAEVSPEMEEKAKAAVDLIIKKAIDLGGTISGEHGIGIHKSEYLPWQLGDVQIDLMKRIKNSFDPKNIMNPGKIWPEGDELRQ